MLGRSGDGTWDALQASLVASGEMHNNARMGWGKAVLAWRDGPEATLAALVKLNDMFALDGHSPPSIAGLMGCMGLFESPKAESKVYGTVQHRGLKRRYANIAQPKANGDAQRPLKCAKKAPGASAKQNSSPVKHKSALASPGQTSLSAYFHSA